MKRAVADAMELTAVSLWVIKWVILRSAPFPITIPRLQPFDTKQIVLILPQVTIPLVILLKLRLVPGIIPSLITVEIQVLLNPL